MGGNIPESNKDWSELKSMDIHSIYNFSDWKLTPKNNIDVINIPSSSVISLTMPMTEEENNMVSEFTSSLKRAISVKRLYICGEIDYRKVISALMLYLLENDKSVLDDVSNIKDQNLILLLKKYSQT